MKTYDVFVSFAEPDRVLAEKLCELFRAVGLKPFFAPKNLLRVAPSDWQIGILDKGLKESNCFLPIFTRESLQRRWVLFEAGAAAALKLTFKIAQVDGISDKDVNEFPFTHGFYHYKLFKKDDLKELIKSIGRERHAHVSGNPTEFDRHVDEVFLDEYELVESVTCKAHRRWVFIAGNLPKNDSNGGLLDRRHIKSFVTKLSERLLEKGFNISACPQVKHVGKAALDAVAEWMESGKCCPITGCKVECEIAGIYPIDRAFRNQGQGGSVLQDRWTKHIMQFRKSYLANKDWLILVGGNEGSTEEFQAVEELNQERLHHIKVCFITCFGGAAKKIWLANGQERPILYFDGSQDWKKADGVDGLVTHVADVIAGPQVTDASQPLQFTAN